MADPVRVALATLGEPIFVVTDSIVLIEPAKGETRHAQRLLLLSLVGGHTARVLDTPENRELLQCPQKL